MQVRIGAVAAAHAGHGLRAAGIGMGPWRPADSSHGNLLVVTGSHVGEPPAALRAFAPRVTRRSLTRRWGRGLGPVPPRERPGCAPRAASNGGIPDPGC